jgi:hypothetical protein
MPGKKASATGKTSATARAKAKRESERAQAEPAEKLENIRARNSTEVALKRDLRARKSR